MPYLYTAFFESHTFGCPLARPLFFGWPADQSTRTNTEQWMMGDALLVSPILYNGTTTARAYFPAGVWYNLYTGLVTDGGSTGTYAYVHVSLSLQPNIHVREATCEHPLGYCW